MAAYEDEAPERSYRRKTPRGYLAAIHTVLAQTTPNMRITGNATEQLNQLLLALADALAEKTAFIATTSKKETELFRHIMGAVRRCFPGELTKHASKKIIRIVLTYRDNGKKRKGLDLILPIGVGERRLRRSFGGRIADTVPVALTQALEYITSEILELATIVARTEKKNTISLKHISIVIESDLELKELLDSNRIELLGQTVPQQIHQFLLKKGKRHRSTKEVGTPRHFHPGTVAVRKIKKYQKQGDCLYIARTAFHRWAKRSVQQTVGANMRVSDNAALTLQHYLENYLVRLFAMANRNAIHAERKTVEVKDITLAREYEHNFLV